ncbi:HNH endonuclease [Corynebacterium heidelbergense]|uniref:HNH endonuclease n=2 Tax=Corynebacterium heidelbergense TaxID=2055947 RepID=A0A364V995_9CORY|nr:HNH endonuclease [Corynebacterium heidelbergense]
MQLPPHHERAFTLDHIVPIARGGDLHGETKPAHRNCNAARGNKREATNPNTLLDW